MTHAKNSLNVFRSPLGKVRGHGAAKSGTHHWWMQRVTGIALAPLTGFFLYNLDQIIHPNYAGIVVKFLARPEVTVAFLAFIACAFYHGALGVRVIIEDYVHTPGRRTALLLLNNYAFLLLGLVAAYLLLLICLPNAEWAALNR